MSAKPIGKKPVQKKLQKPEMYVRDAFFRRGSLDNIANLNANFRVSELGETSHNAIGETLKKVLIPIKLGISYDLTIGGNEYVIKYVKNVKDEKGESKYGANTDYIIQNKNNPLQYRGLHNGLAIEGASNNVDKTQPTEFIVRRDIVEKDKVVTDTCSLSCINAPFIIVKATMQELVLNQKEYNDTLTANADKMDEIMKELDSMMKPEKEGFLHGRYLYVKVDPKARVVEKLKLFEVKNFMENQEQEVSKGETGNYFLVVRLIVGEKRLDVDGTYEISGSKYFEDIPFKVWKAILSLSASRYNAKHPASIKKDYPGI